MIKIFLFVLITMVNSQTTSEKNDLEYLAVKALEYGHPSGTFIKAELIEKDEDWIKVKITYRPNKLMRLAEGKEN